MSGEIYKLGYFDPVCGSVDGESQLLPGTTVRSNPGVTMIVNPKGRYGAGFTATSDLITLSLSPFSGFYSSHGSDLFPLRLGVGNVNLHPEGHTTYLQANPESGDVLTLCLSKALRSQIADEVGVRSFDSTMFLESPSFVGLASMARNYLALDCLGGELVAESLAVLAYTEALSAYQACDTTIARSDIGLVELTRILERINDDPSQDCSLQELAAEIDASVYQLLRCFKKYLRVTPHQYLLNQRFALACNLLQNTELSLAEIALEAGFCSQSHLNNVFRKKLSTTPGQYRRLTD